MHVWSGAKFCVGCSSRAAAARESLRAEAPQVPCSPSTVVTDSYIHCSTVYFLLRRLLHFFWVLHFLWSGCWTNGVLNISKTSKCNVVVPGTAAQRKACWSWREADMTQWMQIIVMALKSWLDYQPKLRIARRKQEKLKTENKQLVAKAHFYPMKRFGFGHFLPDMSRNNDECVVVWWCAACLYHRRRRRLKHHSRWPVLASIGHPSL